MYSILLLSAIAFTVSGQIPNEIAFSAGVTHDVTYQKADTVIYDQVFTNAGNAYDHTTGVFTCPLTGIYVFQFHTLSQQDKSSWLELYQNAYYIASVYSHTSNDYSTSGNSVILRVNKGDKVYIKAVDSSYGYNTDIYGQTDEVYSTFSGYLISPISEELPTVGK